MFGFWRAKPYRDPELGELKRSRGRWRTSVAIPGHGTVQLALSGNRTQPDDDALRLARDLPRRFAALRADIRVALFAHYEPYGDATHDDRDVPKVRNDEMLWQHVRLVGVLVDRLSGVMTVEAAYDTDWDIEHTLGARLQDWKLVELNGSIRSEF